MEIFLSPSFGSIAKSNRTSRNPILCPRATYFPGTNSIVLFSNKPREPILKIVTFVLLSEKKLTGIGFLACTIIFDTLSICFSNFAPLWLIPCAVLSNFFAFWWSSSQSQRVVYQILQLFI